MQQKRISAAAITSLKKALTCIYWYKKDLRSFLVTTLGNRQLVNQLDWSDANYKANIVESLVDHLVKHQDVHQVDLITLIEETTRMTDFLHLKRLEDGEEKAIRAREAVANLTVLYSTHKDIIGEKEQIERRRQAAQERQLQNKGVHDKLEDLKRDFFDLVTSNNPQTRGFTLEEIMRQLFELFDLDPKASFRITGEQIDGAFTFDNTDYLFEAKWQKNPVDIGDLDAFSGKISRRLENTLGLFLSVNGFSKEGVVAHSHGPKLLILMDGSDLVTVLEDRIDLVELLKRKRRHAAQTGEIYLRVHESL